MSIGQSVAPVLSRTLTILDPIVKTVPGLLQGHYYMAKVKYAMGKLTSFDKLGNPPLPAISKTFKKYEPTFLLEFVVKGEFSIWRTPVIAFLCLMILLLLTRTKI